MKIFIGTSGYGYKEWKGKFYPEKLSAKKMLGFYSERFGAVEINNTFYRMPTEVFSSHGRAKCPRILFSQSRRPK